MALRFMRIDRITVAWEARTVSPGRFNTVRGRGGIHGAEGASM
jgi:hypothetical protein